MRTTARFARHLVALLVVLGAPGAGAQVAQLATAQQGGAAAPLLDRPARLRVTDVRLVDALSQLERRSGVALAYSPSLLPGSTRVSCACTDATVRDALVSLLARTSFVFHEGDGLVLLMPRRSDGAETHTPERRLAVDALGAQRTLATVSGPQLSRVSPASLQAVITGAVTTEGGAPVASALVTIPALQLSTTTGEAGLFRIVVPADRVVTRTETLRVSRIGYRPVTVPFDLRTGEIRVDVVMAAQVVALEEVVVTGTAGNQERRAQPAVVASINASDIVAKAPVLNVNELLYARTAGVSLVQASGTAGANTRINIRGQASVSLSNYPLVFVDGVRVTAGPRSVAQVPGGPTAGAGGQQFSALNDLNPADIESIEIVKGPAAATLYGSDASAGVIQILTKKGRLGARQFTQTISVQHDVIDPNFTPYDNYGACTAALVAPTSTNPLCRGLAPGTIVSDNVLVRNDVFNNGWTTSLGYSSRGGGDNFGYFGSVSAENTTGTVEGSFLNHRTGRVNFNWTASPRMNVEAGVALVRAADRLPQGDQSSYSYMVGGDFGSPLTVSQTADGTISGGWFTPSMSVRSISAIRTENITMRLTPSVRVHYSLFPWFTHRLTLGGDLARTTAVQMFPRNDLGWYSSVLNTGVVTKNEFNNTIYTVDYIGNIHRRFGRDGWIASDLSFGTQWVNRIEERLIGNGTGLLTNSANLISSATTTTGAEDFGQSKSLGLLVQEQIGLRDRLFIQVGARVDRNSAFGSEVGSFFLPKAGLSWVVSQEPMWQRAVPSWFSTFRVRTAYGTTGRSPTGTAALQTYVRTNFVTDAGVVQAGVSPGSPGNANLKPERGVEWEAGFDAGFFADRAGLELTYFNKTSRDLLLSQPLPPSSGFAQNPLVNIGEVKNTGVELSFRATPVDRGNVTWDLAMNVSTLKNRITSMGSITPFVNANNQCFKPGVEVAAWCVTRVLSVDTVTTPNRATVSDTAELAGGQFPKWEGNLNTTVTLFRSLRLYAQVDGKLGYYVYNLTRDFRDRSFGNTADAALPAGQGGYSNYERVRRFGPHVTTTGRSIGRALVRDPYIEKGDFVRFRELTATYTLSPRLAQRLRASGASISIGAKNLALWTDYAGWDPEVIGVIDQSTPTLSDVFTTPQSSRLFGRLNVSF